MPRNNGAARLVPIVRSVRRIVARLKVGARLRVGAGFVVGPEFQLARGRTFVAGDRVSIGRAFDCMTHAVIGNDVMISSRVAFIGNDHAFDNPEMSIQDQGLNPASTVKLMGDNLIGYGAVILGNVTIGQGVIVGAGSLVTTDLPEQMICAGRPAKPVKNRYTGAATTPVSAYRS